MALEFLNLRRGYLRRGITGIPDSPSAAKKSLLGANGNGFRRLDSGSGSGSGKYESRDMNGSSYDNSTLDMSSRQGSLKIPGGER